jgi:hypothetical protein
VAEMEDRLADLKTLVSSIPEELQGDDTSEAADRLYTFIEYYGQNA